MRGGGDNVRVRHGRGMCTTGYQTGKVGHVDQEQRSDLVCNLPHAGKVDDPGVGTSSPNDQLWLFALGNCFQLVIVDSLRLPLHAVGDHPVKLAGEAELVPVSQVTAMRQVKTQKSVARLD